MNETNRSYTLPNLLLNDKAVAEVGSLLRGSSLLHIHIFPLLPDLNCSGIISSLRFCYKTSSVFFDQEHLVFTLWIMRRGGLNLNITNSIVVNSTPREDICTAGDLKFQYCCDTILLNMTDRFSIPLENFAFGITSPGFLLRYPALNFQSLQVDHYRFLNIPTPSVGSVYTVEDSDSLETDRGLRLFQFIIGK